MRSHSTFVTLIHPPASRLGAEINSSSGLLHSFLRWNVSQRLSSKAKTWPIILVGENDKLAFKKDVPKDGEAYPRVRLDAAKAFFNVPQGEKLAIFLFYAQYDVAYHVGKKYWFEGKKDKNIPRPVSSVGA